MNLDKLPNRKYIGDTIEADYHIAIAFLKQAKHENNNLAKQVEALQRAIKKKNQAIQNAQKEYSKRIKFYKKRINKLEIDLEYWKDVCKVNLTPEQFEHVTNYHEDPTNELDDLLT